jgi:hypothetical protein
LAGAAIALRPRFAPAIQLFTIAFTTRGRSLRTKPPRRFVRVT